MAQKFCHLLLNTPSVYLEAGISLGLAVAFLIYAG